VGKPVRHYGKWRIRWSDAEGKRHSEVFIKFEDAAFALKNYEVEVEQIRRGLRKAPIPSRTFQKLTKKWMARTPRKRSWKDDEWMLRKYLLPAFARKPLDQINVARVEAVTAQWSVAPKTIYNILTLLNALLNYAVRLEWLEKAPRIQRPPIRNTQDFNYLQTSQEVDRFLNASKEHGTPVHALYATAVFTGMRAGELAGLHWSDVNFEERIITVQRSYDGPTKADRVRYVPILDPLLPVLRAWRLQSPGALVFPNRKGTMHQHAARIFNERFRKVLETAGFEPREVAGKKRPKITFHGLRHTFASHWMMNGGDLFKLQRIGGWRSFEMVQRYAHLAPNAFAGDYDRLGKDPGTERMGQVFELPQRLPNAK